MGAPRARTLSIRNAAILRTSKAAVYSATKRIDPWKPLELSLLSLVRTAQGNNSWRRLYRGRDHGKVEENKLAPLITGSDCIIGLR